MSLPQAQETANANAENQPLRLWLQLLGCSNQIEQLLRNWSLNEYGITLPQFDVLAELDHATAPRSMSQLSKGLKLSNGNSTGVVDRLQRSGLVERKAAGHDRRVQLITLTKDGKTQFTKIASAHKDYILSLIHI